MMLTREQFALTLNNAVDHGTVDDENYQAVMATFNELRADLEAMVKERDAAYQLLYGARCIHCGVVVAQDCHNQDIGDLQLAAHIETCEKHPMTKVKQQLAQSQARVQQLEQQIKEHQDESCEEQIHYLKARVKELETELQIRAQVEEQDRLLLINLTKRITALEHQLTDADEAVGHWQSEVNKLLARRDEQTNIGLVIWNLASRAIQDASKPNQAALTPTPDAGQEPA